MIPSNPATLAPMESILTSSQESAREEALAFAMRELTSGEIDPVFDREGWKKCRSLIATGVTIPREHGGKGQTLAEFVAMMEGLGHGCRRMGLLTAICAHVFGVVEPLHAGGSDDQKSRYLRKLATGEWVGAHGVTEPQAGSDLTGITTRAAADGGDWVITGVKRYTTGGAGADLHVVYARMNEPDRFRLSCFLVEAGTPGLSVRPLPAAGLAGSGLSEVTYDNVRVPGRNMLGKPGAGAMLFQGSIERERACIFGATLGAMEREIELAVAYANERHVGGKAIAGHQAVAHRIADMKVRLDAARLLLYRVTALKAAGKRAPMEAAVAKLFISDAFVASSLDLIRIHGGNGFVAEGGVEGYLRDSLGGIIFSGTNDIQRNIIAGCLGLRG